MRGPEKQPTAKVARARGRYWGVTALAEQVLKILRRMEPSTALKAFRLDLPGMTDAEILARCAELGVDRARMAC